MGQYHVMGMSRIYQGYAKVTILIRIESVRRATDLVVGFYKALFGA